MRIEMECPACGNKSVIGNRTNGDIIRAMSDEELADKIVWLNMSNWNGCPKGRFFAEAVCLDMSCFECWIDWLKEEVGDEKNG